MPDTEAPRRRRARSAWTGAPLQIPLAVPEDHPAYDRLLSLPPDDRPERARALLGWGAQWEDVIATTHVGAVMMRLTDDLSARFTEERVADQELRNEEIDRIAGDVVQRVTELMTEKRVRAHTSSAGLPYEKQVAETLEELATPCRDTADPVGQRTGPRSHKGDILVNINAEDIRRADVNILFEASTRRPVAGRRTRSPRSCARA